MLFELPIKELVFNKCHNADGTRDAVIFRLAEDNMSDTLFLLAHGSKEGLVEVKGRLITLEYALKALLAKGVKEQGVTTVYTISCYGGVQEPVTIDGVTIQSMHDSKRPIRTRAMGLFDGRYVLEVTV